MSISKKAKQVSNEPFHYRYRAFFVGLFILVPAVLIPAVLVFTLVKADWGETWCHLYTKYDRAAGLNKDAPVTIAGQTVGYVESKMLSEQGTHIDVVFKVRKSFTHFVKKNSVARLRQKNFPVGEWEMALTLGDPELPPIQDGDTLQSGMELDLEELVKDMQVVIKTAKQLMEGVAAGEGVIGQLLTEDTLMTMAQDLVVNLNTVVKRAQRTMNETDQAISTVNEAGAGGKLLIDSLMVVTQNTNKMIADLNDFISDLDTLVSGSKGLPKEAEEMMATIDKAGKEADNLLRSLKYHWLLRRSMRKMEREEKEKETSQE